jgi:DNA-binding NarL/FixJ family response regulator
MNTRLLIVDDDARFRSAAKRMLEADGFAVIGEAADGTSGLRAAEELKPDVVLLDIQLPGVPGYHIAWQLARLIPAPQVVLTSIREASDYGDLVKPTGASSFICKFDLTSAALWSLLESSS